MAKKSNTSDRRREIVKNSAYSLMGVAFTYILVSWSIDTANMFIYAATALSGLYTIYFIKTTIKQIIHHDKTTRTRPAKRAH